MMFLPSAVCPLRLVYALLHYRYRIIINGKMHTSSDKTK